MTRQEARDAQALAWLLRQGEDAYLEEHYPAFVREQEVA